AHAGRVAPGAHEVPVLVQLGPMQDVVVLNLLVRIEVKPPLPALLLRSAVPGDRQRLQPAVGKFDEVLLQRLDAEGVLYLERGELAVRAIGLDEKLSVLAEEAGVHPVIVESRIVEIAEHRCVGCVLHRELVLRVAPELRFRGMALGTRLAADECGWLSRGAEKMRPRRVSAGEPCRIAGKDRDSRGSSNDYDSGTRKHCCISTRRALNVGYSNAKMRFQSFFMLITVQPSFFASS